MLPHENEHLWTGFLCIEDVQDFLAAYDVADIRGEISPYPAVEDDAVYFTYNGVKTHFQLPSQRRQWNAAEPVVTVVEERSDGKFWFAGMQRDFRTLLRRIAEKEPLIY